MEILLTGKKLKDLFYKTSFLATNLHRLQDKNIYKIFSDNRLINNSTGEIESWKGISFDEILDFLYEEENSKNEKWKLDNKINKPAKERNCKAG